MLHVVTGPPCGGKSTLVAEQRAAADLVLDLDHLAHALGYPEPHVRWGDQHPAIAAARKARTHLLRAILAGELSGNAWVIDTSPDRGMRAQYERAGARFHLVDPGKDVCLERAADRHPSTRDAIAQWYGSRAPAPLSRRARARAQAVFD